MEFKAEYDRWVKLVNKALEDLIKQEEAPEATIYKAMRYSLMAGGKRLRPVLALAVCELLDGNSNDVMPFACAIEMIHTYSLIHDDLPAMDNDDYRRGRLTSHKVFGEGMAILAGDALLNRAFEIMIGACIDTVAKGKELLERKLKAMEIIATASGTSGMIGGQVVDLESEGKSINRAVLEYMNRCKTGALIKASVLSSAKICNAGLEEMESLKIYSDRLGMAFQIKDDILDLEGNFEEMGKLSGSDAVKRKATYVTVLGPDESKKLLKCITEEAVSALSSFKSKADFLIELAKYLGERKR